MEGQTRVLWNFMETAFQTGALDEILRFSGALTDKKYDNFYQTFADAEDYFMSLEDPAVLEEGLSRVIGILEELTDEEVLEGIGFLLGIVNPWMQKMRQTGFMETAFTEEAKENRRAMLPKAGKALLAVARIGFRSATSSLGGKPAGEQGRMLGRLLNRSAVFIRDVHAENPRAISEFLSGVFDTVDRAECRKAAGILMESLPGERPRLIPWIGGVMKKRARRLLRRRKQEGEDR